MNERYARHELIADWKQSALERACVAIAGMGALGNEAARLLALSGIGSLILCDPDRIEESNLSRTTLFRSEDVGRLKVDAAAEALTAMAPGTSIETRPKPLMNGIGLAELRDVSLVLSCLDSRSARLQLASRCLMVRRPLLDGGTHPWGGEVRPYFDIDGPCYGCGLTEVERGIADAPWSCLDASGPGAGATAVSSALVGGWMASVAIRYLMGLGTPNGLLSIDMSRGTTYISSQRRDETCLLHTALGPSIPIAASSTNTVRELLAALPKGAVALLWAPVQRRVECARCGFSEERWGVPERRECPRCGHSLLPRTTMEIAEAPAEVKLAELGVAPREILTVRTADGLQWVELSG